METKKQLLMNKSMGMSFDLPGFKNLSCKHIAVIIEIFTQDVQNCAWNFV